MSGMKALTKRQADALRNIDLTPKTPVEIGALPSTLRSLQARGLIFVTSTGLWYTQGWHRERAARALEQYAKKNVEGAR